VVNTGKEFSDVVFQNPAGLGVVFADFPNKSTKTVDGFVSSLFVSAGKRIGNKCLVKEWVKFSVNSTMK